MRSAALVFFNRLREIRDRYENQRHRASGLNLLVVAIILWNTIYVQRARSPARSRGTIQPDYHWDNIADPRSR